MKAHLFLACFYCSVSAKTGPGLMVGAPSLIPAGLDKRQLVISFSPTVVKTRGGFKCSACKTPHGQERGVLLGAPLLAPLQNEVGHCHVSVKSTCGLCQARENAEKAEQKG